MKRLYEPDRGRTLVVFGCHADDAEFAAGGLIARTTQAGGRAVIIHMGPHPERPGPDSRARRAAALLGAEVRFCNCGGFGVTVEAVDFLHAALEEFRPALFVPLWPLDMHPHHASAGFLAYRAVLDVIGGGDTRLRSGCELWFSELNPGINGRTFHPDVYVDITGVAEAKHGAIACYEGTAGDAASGIRAWGFWAQSQITVETFRGYEAGVKRAEAFATYSGWDESPLDRPGGMEMFPGRVLQRPWWEGRETYRGQEGELALWD